jgi:magnesium-transporting ATPase (P-type)
MLYTRTILHNRTTATPCWSAAAGSAPASHWTDRARKQAADALPAALRTVTRGRAAAAGSSPVKQQQLRGGAEGTAVLAAAATQLDHLQPHSVTAAEVLQFYSVTEESGLAAGEAEARLARYGPNSLTEAARQGLLSMIAEQFEDRLVQILLVVAVLSGVLSTFEEVRLAIAPCDAES